MQTFLNHIFLLCAIVFSPLFLTSCETELPEGEWSKKPSAVYQLNINKTIIVAGANGLSELLSITSDDSWSVSSSESWIKVSDISGAGTKTITISVEPNMGKEARTGTITVKGKTSGTKSISVSQSGKEFSLSVDKESITVGVAATSEEIIITGDDEWSATCDVDWAILSDTIGSGSKTITVAIEKYTGKDARTGSVMIHGVNSGIDKTISVTQLGKVFTLDVDKEEISVGSAATSEEIIITGDDEWSATCDVEWAILSDTIGNGSKTITVSIESNAGTDARNGSVMIHGKYSGCDKTISVTQLGKVFTLDVDKEEISVGSAATSEAIIITGDDEWSATSDVDWAILSDTIGNGSKTINITIESNAGTDARTGSVTFHGKNSSIDKTISITQLGIAFTLNVDKDEISVGAGETSEVFSISSNDNWKISCNFSWATLSTTTGSGNKMITVSIKENFSNTPRSGKITIKGTNSGINKAIDVSQQRSSLETNGYEFVNLGLPSGLLWATCNVGASKPEEYGDYFAWGATSSQQVYDWKHTPYQTRDTTESSSTAYIKYLGSTTTSYKDSLAEDSDAIKDVLDMEDDAAHVNWGGSWRMPTKAEQDELRDSNNCTWSWTTQNGVAGYEVTSKKNGKHIFIPAAGYRGDSSLRYEGSRGYYWSSSLSTSNPYDAYGFGFDSKKVYWEGSGRSSGRSVRPVCAPSE